MPTTTPLPRTAVAVMAILYYGGTMSGYEIRQWALRSLAHFYWTPAQSQIYRELTRLVDLGHVERLHDQTSDEPQRTVRHTLTTSGRAALTEWASERDNGSPQLKHPIALQLFVGGLGSIETSRHALERHVQRTEDRLADLEALTIGLEDHEPSRFAFAVAEWATAIHRADREGALAVIDALDTLYKGGDPGATAHESQE
ncbi:MAG: PadR family transcriptional regulator [Actinomycetota bacterium]